MDGRRSTGGRVGDWWRQVVRLREELQLSAAAHAKELADVHFRCDVALQSLRTRHATQVARLRQEVALLRRRIAAGAAEGAAFAEGAADFGGDGGSTVPNDSTAPSTTTLLSTGGPAETGDGNDDRNAGAGGAGEGDAGRRRKAGAGEFSAFAAEGEAGAGGAARAAGFAGAAVDGSAANDGLAAVDGSAAGAGFASSELALRELLFFSASAGSVCIFCNRVIPKMEFIRHVTQACGRPRAAGGPGAAAGGGLAASGGPVAGGGASGAAAGVFAPAVGAAGGFAPAAAGAAAGVSGAAVALERVDALPACVEGRARVALAAPNRWTAASRGGGGKGVLFTLTIEPPAYRSASRGGSPGGSRDGSPGGSRGASRGGSPQNDRFRESGEIILQGGADLATGEAASVGAADGPAGVEGAAGAAGAVAASTTGLVGAAASGAGAEGGGAAPGTAPSGAASGVAAFAAFSGVVSRPFTFQQLQQLDLALQRALPADALLRQRFGRWLCEPRALAALLAASRPGQTPGQRPAPPDRLARVVEEYFNVRGARQPGRPWPHVPAGKELLSHFLHGQFLLRFSPTRRTAGRPAGRAEGPAGGPAGGGSLLSSGSRGAPSATDGQPLKHSQLHATTPGRMETYGSPQLLLACGDAVGSAGFGEFLRETAAEGGK